jgi:hypothetical protein
LEIVSTELAVKAGDGIDIGSGGVAVDLKADSGLEIVSTELAVKLDTSADSVHMTSSGLHVNFKVCPWVMIWKDVLLKTGPMGIRPNGPTPAGVQILPPVWSWYPESGNPIMLWRLGRRSVPRIQFVAKKPPVGGFQFFALTVIAQKRNWLRHVVVPVPRAAYVGVEVS